MTGHAVRGKQSMTGRCNAVPCKAELLLPPGSDASGFYCFSSKGSYKNYVSYFLTIYHHV